ncbi:probable galacturonosyltransferase 7 isoform X2 [Tanacetum coccineum]
MGWPGPLSGLRAGPIKSESIVGLVFPCFFHWELWTCRLRFLTHLKAFARKVASMMLFYGYGLASVGFYEMKMKVVSFVRGCDDFTGLDKAEIVQFLAGQLIMFAAMANRALMMHRESHQRRDELFGQAYKIIRNGCKVQQPMAPVTLSTSKSVSHSGSRLPHAQHTHGGVEPANRPVSSGRISHLFIDIQSCQLLNSEDHANFLKKLTETVLSADLIFLISFYIEFAGLECHPCSKLPRESIKPDTSTQVVIDTFIYWGACENTFADDGEATTNHMVVSFDLVTKKFKVVDLPDSLTKELWSCCSVSKLRGFLVVFGYIEVEEAIHFCAWVMKHDSSFRKLFTIGAPVDEIDKKLGFKKNGETIFETRKNDIRFTTLLMVTAPPANNNQGNLGISGSMPNSSWEFLQGSLHST